MQNETDPGRLSERDDTDLVHRVLGGDSDAYRHLVQRHQDVLYRHALGMTGSPDAAADAVQVALVKGYTHLRRCREPRHFGAWVFRIVTNGCKDFLKDRRRRELSLDVDVREVTDPKTDPLLDLERMELRRMLMEALARVPAINREAFLLKHVEGHSYEEIATMLDVSVPALKMRVLRAREVLRSSLEAVR